MNQLTIKLKTKCRDVTSRHFYREAAQKKVARWETSGHNPQSKRAHWQMR